MYKVMLAGAIIGAMVVAASSADAQQLVYTPVNPAFGGNPFNSTQLEADAAAQNQYKSSGAPRI